MNHKLLNLSDQDCRELRLKIENHLSDLAFYTACQDDHPFRRRAYRKVKVNLYRFENVLPDYINNKKLKLIPGVGDAIAAEITQFVSNGHSKKLETMRVGIPAYIDSLKLNLGYPDWLANINRKQPFFHPLQLFVALESAWLINQQIITMTQSSLLRKELISLLNPYQSKLVLGESANLKNLILLNYSSTDWLVDSERQFLNNFSAVIYPVIQNPLRLAQRSFFLSLLNQNHLPKTSVEFDDLMSQSNNKIFCSWMHPLFYSRTETIQIHSNTECVLLLLHPLMEVMNAQLIKKIDSTIPIWFAALTPGIETYLMSYTKAFSNHYMVKNKILNTVSNSRLERFLENLMN